MLNLPEELLLLALDDQSGSPYGVSMPTPGVLRYGLAAAMLADLALQGKISVEDQRVLLPPREATGGNDPAEDQDTKEGKEAKEGKGTKEGKEAKRGKEAKAGKEGKEAKEARKPEPTGDPLLDDLLKQLCKVDRPHKVKYWIGAVGFRKLPKQVAQNLAARGVLREEDRRYHGASPNAVPSAADPPTKYWIKQGLRAGVLANAPLQPRQVALLSLMRGCRLLNLIFTRDERKAAGKRVDELVKGEDFGAALGQTLSDLEAATKAVVTG